MDRLSAEDQLMLWPDETWPQENGALAILDGGALLEPDGRFRVEAVRETIEDRLHLVPRLRQVLSIPGRGLGPPLWVDAPAFDLSRHVQVSPLPPPGGEAELLAATEQVRRRRLDRSRPLWEMWFLPGLTEGRVGLFVKLHHALADGIAVMATVGALLDTASDAAGPAAVEREWTPAPAPTERELRADVARRRGVALGRLASTLAHPAASVRLMRSALPAVGELFVGERTPATSLNRMVGADRAFALLRSSIDIVTGIAHAHGATVDDVLLAVTAGGIRALLRSRGEPVDGVAVRVFVPVTLRHGPLDRARGNALGQMVVPLPIGVADPGQRLRQIAAATAERKARRRPSLALLRSPFVRAWLLKLMARHPVNVTTADLRGPSVPSSLCGARLLEVFPVLPLIGNVSLGVGVLSYAEQFAITVVADRDAYPDVDVFVAGASEDLRTLTAAEQRSLNA